MIIELNINLHVIGHANSPRDCNWRAVVSRSYLRDAFVGASFHRLQDDVKGEDILLVHIETGYDLVEDILKKVATLSERIEQECIALRWPYDNEGVLVGPKATTWGAWDESKFKRFGSTFQQSERSVAI